MYTLLMAALVLFPWVLALHIAVGSVCVARRAVRQAATARGNRE